MSIFRYAYTFDGREFIESDDRCNDRSRISRIDSNMAAVAELIKSYRRITSCMITEELKTSTMKI